MNTEQKLKLNQFIKKAKDGSASRRAVAVSLLEAGISTDFTGYTKKHAERLRRNFVRIGDKAFEDKRKNNRDRILSSKEKRQIVQILKTKIPKDVISGCEVEYWTTGLLGLYIFEQTGKKYKSKTSEHLLFKEAKLTFHLPGKSYEKSDEKAKVAWMKETKPILKKHWSEENTVILCEDEMVLTAKTTMQRVWLPRGEYPPVIETNNRKKNKSFYGFLNLKTGQEHAFITDWQNMHITAGVLTKLRKIYPTQKLVIIWDNCGWHRGSKVVEWIEQDGNTETIHFPPYTPDLNPQEHVWKAGRKEVTHNQFINKIEETADKFKQYIESKIFGYELLGFRAGLAQD